MQVLNYTLLVVCVLALVCLNCNSADLEGSGKVKSGVDEKKLDTVNVSNGAKGLADQNNEGNDLAGSGSAEKALDNDRTDSKIKDSSKALGLNPAGNEETKIMDSDSHTVGGTVVKVNDSSTVKAEPGAVEPVRKGGLGGEKCDSSSNSCTIDDKPVVACLRVPGSESPDLSLLIQNKGKGTVSVTISAPAFVQLEKNQIDILERESKKVKVSIGNKGTGSIMVLKAGNGNCSLDFGDLIPQGAAKYSFSTSQIAVINFFKSTSIFWVLFLAAFLAMALLGTFVSLWRKHSANNQAKYEKLEVELPVSSGSKKIADSTEGWDDSWGDSWDDEEAPKAPSTPITSSLSQGSIASRRINKEGWKD